MSAPFCTDVAADFEGTTLHRPGCPHRPDEVDYATLHKVMPLHVIVPAMAGRPAWMLTIKADFATGVVDVATVGGEHVAPLGIARMRLRGEV